MLITLIDFGGKEIIAEVNSSYYPKVVCLLFEGKARYFHNTTQDIYHETKVLEAVWNI